MINPVCPECDVTIKYNDSGMAYCPECGQEFPTHKTIQKRVMAIKTIDRLEFECPGCHTYMTVCDTQTNIFSRGEASQTGVEYLFCQKCGKEFEFKDVLMPHETPTPTAPF